MAKHPPQTVYVFQGGGALGAYQAGVAEALDSAGMATSFVATMLNARCNARRPNAAAAGVASWNACTTWVHTANTATNTASRHRIWYLLQLFDVRACRVRHHRCDRH